LTKKSGELRVFSQENLTKTLLSKIKAVLVRELAMKKKVVPVAVVISVMLVPAVSAALLKLNFYQTEVKADDSGYHPNTLFEIPNEMRVEFHAASNEVPKFYNASEPSTPSYSFGEIVYLRLVRTRLRDGENPPIANVTISVSDDMGNVVWSRNIGLWGGGSGLSGGGGGIAVPWVPDAIGNYTAGVVFEGLIYDVPNDYSNVISIEICRSCLISGKVTEKDGITAISNVLVEALVDGVQKLSTATDVKGAYTLPLRLESVYDIRASTHGYTAVVQRNVSTDRETICLNFALEPIENSKEDPAPQQQPPAEPDRNATLKATSVFISLESSVTVVNQSVRVNMFIEPLPPTSSEVLQGITVVISSPDGQVFQLGPYSTDSNGLQHMFFTPGQIGNYTLQIRYPGQIFKSGEIEYEAATSPIATLTVNAQPATLSNPELAQDNLPTPGNQQAGETPPVSVFASIVTILAVSTVSPIYFRRRKGRSS
jgi:hypothetical protein